MNPLEFVFKLAIFQCAFEWAWVVIAIPLAVIFSVLRFEKGSFAVKLVGAYLLVSVCVLLTRQAFGNDTNVMLCTAYAVFAFMALVLNCADNVREKHSSSGSYQNPTWEETTILCGQGVLLVVALFIPALVTNPVTSFLYEKFSAFANFPLVFWALGAWGTFALAIVFSNSACAASWAINSAKNDKRNSFDANSQEEGADVTEKELATAGAKQQS